jgi:hypothetical protein
MDSGAGARRFTSPAGNRLSRLIKTPKLHLGDTGLAAALLGVDAEALASQNKYLAPVL